MKWLNFILFTKKDLSLSAISVYSVVKQWAKEFVVKPDLFTTERTEITERDRSISRCVIFLFFLFVATSVSAMAEEQPTVFESAEANFDGKTLVLTGDVTFEHDIGKVSAQEVIFTPVPGEKKVSLASLDMRKNIKFVFRAGGQFNCAQAHLDYQEGIGRFYGDDDHEFVVYTENCRDAADSGKCVPLVVKGRQMVLHLGEGETKSQIKEINIDGQVTVDYNSDYIAAADYGMYQRMIPDGEEKAVKTALPGIISLRAAENSGVCQVTNRNGDLITASQIGIDTIKRQICFAYPKGAINIVREGRPTQRLDFSSDTLVLDDKNQTMTLRDNVSINQKGMGHLSNEQEVKVFQQTVNGKKLLHTIEANGKTILTRTEEEKEQCHQVICYGTLIVDHSKLEIVMTSPRQSDGSVREEEQVFFEDQQGLIYADKATIKYGLSGAAIAVKKIALEGHVRLMNNYGSKTNSPLAQYALADAVEYLPQEQEMLFTANKGQRVLFFDKANDLKVSAPGLKIKRDANTKKDSFKGIGDVRFSLIDHEIAQLKQKFSLNFEKPNAMAPTEESPHEK